MTGHRPLCARQFVGLLDPAHVVRDLTVGHVRRLGQESRGLVHNRIARHSACRIIVPQTTQTVKQRPNPPGSGPQDVDAAYVTP